MIGDTPNEPNNFGLGTRPWLVVPLVAGIHLTYAVGYWWDHQVAKITGLYFASRFFGGLLPFALVIAAVMAITPMAVKMTAKQIHLFLWPQQFLLMLMGLSALNAVYHSTYPDGYQTSAVFILADQCFTIWLMIGHFFTMVRNAQFK